MSSLCFSNAMKSSRVVSQRRLLTTAVLPEHIIDSLPRSIQTTKQAPMFGLTMPPQQVRAMPAQEPINKASIAVAAAAPSRSSESKSMFAIACVAVGAAVAKLEMDRSTRDGLSKSRYGDRTTQPSAGLFGI